MERKQKFLVWIGILAILGRVQGFEYRCRPRESSEECEIAEIETIAGPWFHPLAESPQMVKSVQVIKSKAQVVPAWIFGEFENLQRLWMNESGILRIGSSNTFENATSLKEIHLARNEITKISSYSFMNLKNLELIDLSYNLISEVDEISFFDIPKLKILNLEGNQIKAWLRETVAYNKALQEVNLNQNLLESFHVYSFFRNENLQKLFLNQNRLKDKIHLHFKVYRLQRIEMNDNQMTGIELTKDYCGSKNLSEHFEAQNNQLTTFGVYGCGKISINVFNNSLSGLFDTFPNLIELNNGKNPEKSIKHFHTAVNLEVLNISDIQMITLPLDAFEPFEKLKILDLSFNKLEHFDLEVFRPLKRLEYLNLNGTGMKQLNTTLLKEVLPKLRTLELSENEFDCETTGKILFELDEVTQISVLDQKRLKSLDLLKRCPEFWTLQFFREKFDSISCQSDPKMTEIYETLNKMGEDKSEPKVDQNLDAESKEILRKIYEAIIFNNRNFAKQIEELRVEMAEIKENFGKVLIKTKI